jgi:hypothetical protein
MLFIHFNTLTKNTTGFNIVILKTDNCRECDNINLIKYLADNSIRFTHSLSSCSQQNGHEERLNQTFDTFVKTPYYFMLNYHLIHEILQYCALVIFII